ncbi:MAG: AI-2E family transporter [Patescibacteria group bacterium]
MPKTIEISHRTIIFTLLVLGAVWVLNQISSILITLFIALLLTTALNPVVDKLTQYRAPRPLAILVVYIGLIALLIGGLASIITPLVDETTNFVNRLPDLFDQFGAWLESVGIQGVDGRLIANQASQLGQIPANIVKFVIFLFSNLIAVVTLLVITFYMLLERKNLNKYLLVLFGGDGEGKAKTFVDKLEASLGGWVRGELVLMFIIGTITYIGLRLLGIPYALPLAIIAGVLEILPNIGPIVSAIPAILVALTVSPIMALGVAALYFVIQQLENSLIAPKVMQRAIGVNPIITIVSLAVGFQLAGAVGAILAVPIVIVLRLVLTDVFGFQALRKFS